MKEYLVEVFKCVVMPRRELVCDFCNATLHTPQGEEPESFFAKIYDYGQIFLEEYLCEECRARLFPKFKVVNFEDAEEEVKDAIRLNLEQTRYGYVIGVSSWEEAELLLENPFLIKLWGEEF